MDTVNKLTVRLGQQINYIDLQVMQEWSVLFSFKEYQEVTLDGKQINFPFKDLINQDSIILSNSKEEKLLPGLYHIVINSINYYFKVEPQNIDAISYEAMLGNLKHRIAKYINLGLGKDSLTLLKDVKLSFKYQSILSIINKVLVAIKQIEDMQLNELTKVHKKEIKLQANQSVYNYLSQVTGRIDQIIKLQFKELEKELNTLQRQKEEIVTSIQYSTQILRQIDYSYDEYYVNHKKYFIKLQNQSLISVQNQYKICQHYLFKLTEFQRIVNNYKVKYHASLVVRTVYHSYKIERLLSSIDTKQVTTKLITTEKMFEYHVLLCIVDILNLLDFEAQCLDGLFDNGFITFKRGNLKLELVYDKECPLVDESDKSQLCSLNSRHNRPDFVINYYKDSKYCKSLVLDAKYRNDKFLYSNKYQTTTMCTILDYKQLVYNDSSRVSYGTVEKVIIIYPKQYNKFIKTDGVFKQIASFVAINLQEEIPKELFRNIQKFIG